MGDAEDRESQPIDKSMEKWISGWKSADGDGLIAPPAELVKCEICEAEFPLPARSRVLVCSPACKRERQLRYLRAYRQRLKTGRASLLALFGGVVPTDEEILAFLSEREEDP